MSPARSAEEVARLAVLQVDSPDGRTGVPLDSLLGVSDTDALKLRALEIKVAFANINPVYHNRSCRSAKSTRRRRSAIPRLSKRRGRSSFPTSKTPARFPPK